MRHTKRSAKLGWRWMWAQYIVASCMVAAGCLPSDSDDDDEEATSSTTTSENEAASNAIDTGSATTSCACQTDAECAEGQLCSDCTCIEHPTATTTEGDACVSYSGTFEWGDCINEGSDACGEGGGCLPFQVAGPPQGVCINTEPCSSDCDCPAPAGNGAASICTAYGECLLLCASDDHCPTSLQCLIPEGNAAGFCASVATGDGVADYEDCNNDFCSTGLCLGLSTSDNQVLGRACFPRCPVGAECASHSSGADVTCSQFNVDGTTSEALCHISCAESACPDGMVCSKDDNPESVGICVWPVEPIEGTTGEPPATDDGEGSGSTSESGESSGSADTEESGATDTEIETEAPMELVGAELVEWFRSQQPKKLKGQGATTLRYALPVTK